MIDAAELAERFKLSDDELEDHLQLLNLVNFGGGCYAVYAERVDDGRTIHVEKELYGDEFRRPARLSPLEAKSLLLALDLVGPLVAADAGTTLDDVRAQARGGVRALRHARRAHAAADAARRGRAVGALGGRAQPRASSRSSTSARQADDVERRVVEPHYLRGVRGDWYCDTWDRTRDGERTFRVDRIREARGARRDVRAPRERDRARRRRARRSRRHGLGVVLGRRRALGARGPARHRAPGRRRRARVDRLRLRALALHRALPLPRRGRSCSSPSRCAPGSRRAHASSRRSCARTPPPTRSDRPAGALAERRRGRARCCRRPPRPPSSRAPCSSGSPRARSSCRRSRPSTRAPTAFVNVMPAYCAGLDGAGVKLVSVFPDNRESGLPAINALVIVLDSATGLAARPARRRRADGLPHGGGLGRLHRASRAALPATSRSPAPASRRARHLLALRRARRAATSSSGITARPTWTRCAAWAAEHAPAVDAAHRRAAPARPPTGAAIVITGIPIGAERRPRRAAGPARRRPRAADRLLHVDHGRDGQRRRAAAGRRRRPARRLPRRALRRLARSSTARSAAGSPTARRPRPRGQVVVANLGVGAHDVVFGSAVLARAERDGDRRRSSRP